MPENKEEFKKENYKIVEELNVEIVKFNSRHNQILKRIEQKNENDDLSEVEEAIKCYKEINNIFEKILSK